MLAEGRECGVDVKFLFDFHTQTTASKRGNGATGQRCTQKASSQRRAYVTALLDSHTHPKLFSCTAGQSIRELSSARARDLLRLYLAGSKMICQLWICCGPTKGNGGKWESATLGPVGRMSTDLPNAVAIQYFKCDWNSNWAPLLLPILLLLQAYNSLSLSC